VTPPTGSNQPPGVSIISPVSGATVASGSSVTIEANVTDADGFVTKVEFFAGASLLGSAPAFPFRFVWSPPPGAHSLTAVATDNAGAATASAPVSITVTSPGGGPPPNQLPTVSIVSPSAGATFPAGATVDVLIDASDADGSVAKVDLFEGTTLVGTASASPFHVLWTPAAAGTFSLHAVATDNGGSSASSAPLSVVVQPEPGGGTPGWFTVLSGVSVDLHGVFFADANSGWAVGQGGTILHTADGGATWAAQSSGTFVFLTRVQFVSATRGWAVGESGTVLSTSDGGATWSPQPTGTTAALLGLSFVSSTTGWVVGQDGTLLRTTDGGATWTSPIPPEPGVDFSSVSFASATRGWIGGYGFVQTTSDGGLTWARQAITFQGGRLIPVAMTDGRAVSTTTAIFVGIVGPVGKSVRTTDGGSTWTLTDANNMGTLGGVAFGDATHLWAVGQFGSVVASSDGGSTWVAQPTPPSDHFLLGVWFVDANRGWAVGRGGTILKTTNGGRSGS
jgi:photosystem II stability/assembly factor-like uncharacterized protein